MSTLRVFQLCACLGSLALTACTPGPTDRFDYVETGLTVHATADGGEVLLPVDMSSTHATSEYSGWTPAFGSGGGAEIYLLSLDSLTLKITGAASDNNVTALAGTLAIRPDGATDASHDVALGSLAPLTVAPGIHKQFVGSPAVNALFLQMASTTGRATLVVSPALGIDEVAGFAFDLEIRVTAQEYGR